MYADYAFYEGAYHGSLIEEDQFDALIRSASLILDRLTYHRIDQYWAANKQVKMATCAVADQLKSAESVVQEPQNGIKSESTDGYSVTYTSAAELQQRQDAAIYQIVSDYLLYTGLMDRSISQKRCW